MAEIELTKMSSKGQIVIPREMRKGFKEGEKFVVIKIHHKLLLKPVKDFEENIEEDLEFAHRTEEAWRRYEKGEFISKTTEDFLKELDKC